MRTKIAHQFRSFSRTFTSQIGLLEERPYHPSLTLLESRIVYEMAQTESILAKSLVNVLQLDKGYLSRTLGELKRKKIIKETKGKADSREKWLSLTPKGKQIFQKINQASLDRMNSLANKIGQEKSSKAATKLAEAELLLTPEQKLSISEVKYRELAPGDLGWVIEKHGEIYAKEYGWNQEFEILVAEIATGFAKGYDAKKERAWIAHARGIRLGCVFLVKSSPTEAKLRILLVDPIARGLGLGSALVRQCITFAQKAEYKTVTLWTNDVLVSARKIYEAEGFRLVKEEPHFSFGKKLVGQYWTKDLDPQ